MPSLDAIAHFVQVIDSGSFTQAARVLGLPKSTLSERIARLETELGVQLIRRSTRRLSLTDTGQVFLDHARAMQEAAQAAQAAVSQLREEEVGRLRITAPEASSQHVFAPLIAQFRRRYPRIEIDFIVTDTQLDLIAENIDLAFRTGRLADSALVSRRIAQVQRILVAAPAYLEARGCPQALSELSRHDCLVHHPMPRWPFVENSRVQWLEPSPHGLRSNSLVFIQNLAESGAGIAMLPALMCREALESGRLVRILKGHALPPNDSYVIYPTRLHHTAALRCFLDFLERSAFGAMLACTDLSQLEVEGTFT